MAASSVETAQIKRGPEPRQGELAHYCGRSEQHRLVTDGELEIQRLQRLVVSNEKPQEFIRPRLRSAALAMVTSLYLSISIKANLSARSFTRSSSVCGATEEGG